MDKMTWAFIFPILIVVGGIAVIVATLYSLYIGYTHHNWQEVLYVLACTWGLYTAYLFVGFKQVNNWIEEEREERENIMRANQPQWKIQIDWDQGRYDEIEAQKILANYLTSDASLGEAMSNNNILCGDKTTIQEVARRLKGAGLSVTLLPAPDSDNNEQ